VKRFLADIVEWVSAALAAALAVVVFLQVFNRFVLKAPLAWSEDLAMLLFQWVAFLGAAVGVRRTRHFGIELVVKTFPEKARHRVERIVPVLMGVVAVTMITKGLDLLAVNRNRTFATMNLSYTWAFLAIPVSGVLMILFLAAREVRRWRGTPEGSPHP
jgi:TRAP-type C4-dicarboxylate transport system permease small subunit